MNKTQRMIASLIGDIASRIRTRFGVVESMTPKRVMDLSHDFERTALEHLSALHNVKEITKEDGTLLIPPPE
jgi:hypothetical protein